MDPFNPIVQMSREARLKVRERKSKEARKRIRTIIFIAILFVGMFAYAGMTSKSAQAAENEPPAVTFIVQPGVAASLPIELVRPDEDRDGRYRALRAHIEAKQYLVDQPGRTGDLQGKCFAEIIGMQYSVYCAANLPNRKPMTDAQLLDAPEQVLKFVRNFSGRYFEIRLRHNRGKGKEVLI